MAQSCKDWLRQLSEDRKLFLSSRKSRAVDESDFPSAWCPTLISSRVHPSVVQFRPVFLLWYINSSAPLIATFTEG